MPDHGARSRTCPASRPPVCARAVPPRPPSMRDVVCVASACRRPPPPPCPRVQHPRGVAGDQAERRLSMWAGPGRLLRRRCHGGGAPPDLSPSSRGRNGGRGGRGGEGGLCRGPEPPGPLVAASLPVAARIGALRCPTCPGAVSSRPADTVPGDGQPAAAPAADQGPPVHGAHPVRRPAARALPRGSSATASGPTAAEDVLDPVRLDRRRGPVRFARESPHRAAIARLRPDMAMTWFVTWTWKGGAPLVPGTTPSSGCSDPPSPPRPPTAT